MIYRLHKRNNIRRYDPPSQINPPLLQPAEPRSRGDLCLSWQQWVCGRGVSSNKLHVPPCTVKKGKNERCSRCSVTQIPSTQEVLKCGDVWTEPSVSVATLHPLPHPHFAIQNKHSSLWMCVISLCHNTDRQNLSLTPQRQCKPQHENAALRCSGGKRPKCSEIGIPGR